MSYCRWSSMGFRCDLYIYADSGGGYTCHVAGSRNVYPPDWREDPDWDKFTEENAQEWTDDYNSWLDAIMKLPKVDIELEEAGETLHTASGPAMAIELRRLRELGYMFPDGVIEALESEDD